MKKIFSVMLIVCLFSLISCEKKKEVKRHHGKMLPTFSLKDPNGVAHSSKSIVSKGMVLVVTAPTMKQSGAQKGWDKLLEETMPKGGAKLVFLEDMQPSAFKGTAKKEMKKDYKEGGPTLLLIDETGKVREELGVDKNATAVLAYNKDGELVHTCKSGPSKAEAEVLWSKVK
ncbi:MAG: hypothetical protein HN337_00905 [Deltaproteobacteria bacterium]|jgi:hypothetical protein|nr:hypothetical protein [Deltaproteobacteria bacterium]